MSSYQTLGSLEAVTTCIFMCPPTPVYEQDPPRPLRHHSMSSAISSAKLPHSKASEVPEELFERILWHAVRRDPYQLLTMEGRREYRRLLVRGSAVCKYWARLSRLVLFQSITLRTLDDAMTLCEMVEAPRLPGVDPVAELLAHLHLDMNNESPPWIHHVFLLIYPKIHPRFKPEISVILLCHHGDSAMEKPWRSLHASLPRTVPPSLMQVHKLNLNHVSLRDWHTPARMIASVSPSLQYLNASFCTFRSKLSNAAFRSFTRKRGPMSQGSMWFSDIHALIAVLPFEFARRVEGRSGTLWVPPKITLPDDDWEVITLLADHGFEPQKVVVEPFPSGKPLSVPS